MVADFLRPEKMYGRQVWVLALFLLGVISIFHAGVGKPPVHAQSSRSSSGRGGHVSEEDLPSEEKTPAAATPDQSFPLLSPPSPAKEAAATAPVPLPSPLATLGGAVGMTPAPPALPANASLSPQDLVALHFVEVGKSLLEQGDVERAREQFERAASVAPLQPYGYYFLGRVAFTRGDHKQALAFLRKAELSFAPGDRVWLGETIDLQGAIYEELGNYAQARTSYQRCLHLVPTNLKALSALARLSEEEPLPSDTFPR